MSKEQIEEMREMEKSSEIAGPITSAFIKKMQREKHLVAVGTGGGGSSTGGINCLAVTFESYQELDLQQARRLLVECVEEFLPIINATKEFQPYASEFPFTYKNISIVILFINKQNMSDFAVPPFISSVGMQQIYSNGNIIYKMYPNEELETINKEPYEEALEIIKQEQSQE